MKPRTDTPPAPSPSAPPHPAADPDSCEAAFALIIGRCTTTLDGELAVFLNGDDPAGPHKSRVALRRITTALDAFAPILRKSARKATRSEAKRIFRLLGQVRDSDVYLADHADEPGHPERLAANRKLRHKTREKLRRIKAVAFAPRLSLALQPDGGLLRTSPSARALRADPLRDFAADALDRAWQAAERCGPSLRDMRPTDQHDFRKDMKTLRYLAEFFADQFPALSQDPFRADFRDLQDALGTLNDFDVALALEGRARPKTLPPRQDRALVQAQAIWTRLRATTPPWR